MKIEIQKEMENLSSRKLWTIINTETTLNEKILIDAAKLELQRRDQFSAARAFSAPH